MRYLNISELRQNLPTVLDSVVENGEALLVTKRGRVVAKIMPASGLNDGDEAHPLRGMPVEVSGDFDEPAADLWKEDAP